MSEMIRSFGVRWNSRDEGIQKKHIFEDIAKFSLLAAAGCGLKLSFPKIAVLTTLVAGDQAYRYALSSASIEQRNEFIDTILKTSFLYGAFLIGVGAGTTYRGLVAIKESLAFYNLTGMAAGFHRLFWTASITFPLAKLLIAIPSICFNQREGFDRADTYFAEGFGKLRSVYNTVKQQFSSIPLRTLGLNQTTASTLIQPEQIAEAGEGATLVFRGMQSLTNLNEKRDVGQDRRLAPLQSFGRINNFLNYFANSQAPSEPEQNESTNESTSAGPQESPNASNTPESSQEVAPTAASVPTFTLNVWAKQMQQSLSKLAYTPEHISPLSVDQIKALLKKYPLLDRDAFTSHHEAYGTYVMEKVIELQNSVSQLKALEEQCLSYSALTSDDLKPLTSKVQKDVNDLTKEILKIQSLLEEIGEIKKTENQSSHTSIQEELANLPLFDLAETEKMKLRLQAKLSSSEQKTEEDLEDSLVFCMGASWTTADYQKLADVLGITTMKLDEELDKRKLNTRRELLEKKILLTVEEAKNFSTTALLQAEQEKRLYSYLKTNRGHRNFSVIQKAIYISVQILGTAAVATYAPRCFAAGIVIAVWSGKVTALLTRLDTPPNERPSTTYRANLDFYVSLPKIIQIFFLSSILAPAYWTEKMPGLYFLTATGAGMTCATQASMIGNEAFLWFKKKNNTNQQNPVQ